MQRMSRTGFVEGNGVALVVALAAGLAAVAGCAGNECTVTETRCDGRFARVCYEQEAGDGPFSGKHTEWIVDDCGAADRCVVDAQRGPRCTIAPPLPATCAEQGGLWDAWVCDSNDLVHCDAGLAVHRQPCRQCQALARPNHCSDTVWETTECQSASDCVTGPAACLPVFSCSGALLFPCHGDGDCAPGLSCHDQICTRPCGCPDPKSGDLFSTCFDCRDDIDDPVTTSSAIRSATLYNVCRGGWCKLELP
jgi:hypothetical protein